METKTKHTTTTAAAAKEQKTARRYEISEATAALLDCITATHDLYGQIVDALQACYGAELTDEAAEPYLKPIETLTDLLYKDIDGRIVEAFMQDSNSHSSSPVI